MKIMPLPQFEADADPERRSALTVAEQAARLQKPATIVVKYGDLGWVGEYAWEGDASPGCGSKILCKTHRGTDQRTRCSMHKGTKERTSNHKLRPSRRTDDLGAFTDANIKPLAPLDADVGRRQL